MRRIIPLLVFLLLTCSAAMAGLHEEQVEYRTEESPLRGYLVFDDQFTGKRPGILVVHEWWGLNDYARRRARMLAELGYTALAVDMYGEGRVAEHPQDAARFSGALRQNLPLARTRFVAALNLLKNHPTVDGGKIAAIGYCFGGGLVLEMARAGVDLDGVVSFHGSLSTTHPASPGEVKARVLVFNGAEDPFVTEGQIASFKTEMASAGVHYRFVNYPGARHSFTNPEADELGARFDLPLAYDPVADAQSWQAMEDFLAEIFHQEPGRH